MPADALAFVQFIHPGHERAPDVGDVKSRNRVPHRRKFLLADGAYLLGGERRAGRVAFWGEWEPPSRVIARFPADGDLPRFVHEPILERPDSFRGLQNTDPYVFGDRFLYTGCQQHTNRGATETQLRRLTRGSVILFGSSRDLSRFVVDTVGWSFRSQADRTRQLALRLTSNRSKPSSCPSFLCPPRNASQRPPSLLFRPPQTTRATSVPERQSGEPARSDGRDVPGGRLRRPLRRIPRTQPPMQHPIMSHLMTRRR